MKKFLKVTVFSSDEVLYSSDCVNPDSFAHILALFAEKLTKVVYEVYEVTDSNMPKDEK